MHYNLLNYLDRVNNRTRIFDIPYGQEISIRPTDNRQSIGVSVNALDSIAKYAGKVNIPMQDALGLSYRET